MKVIPVTTTYFGYDGRGPTLRRWIHDRDLVLPGSDGGRGQLPGRIKGAEYDSSWVVFRGMQVTQIVPEEVHSYWFFGLLPENSKRTGAYEVIDSAWKASFHPRHLASQRHFVLVFYDDLVEVLCRELVFGSGAFHIAEHPELSYYGS